MRETSSESLNYDGIIKTRAKGPMFQDYGSILTFDLIFNILCVNKGIDKYSITKMLIKVLVWHIDGLISTRLQ